MGDFSYQILRLIKKSVLCCCRNRFTEQKRAWKKSHKYGEKSYIITGIADNWKKDK